MPRPDTQLEIFVDDMAFASYVSSSARSRSFTFDEMGDCFIRELDFSRLTLKIRDRGGDKKDDEKDRTLGRLTGNTLDTLKQCLVSCTRRSIVVLSYCAFLLTYAEQPHYPQAEG